MSSDVTRREFLATVAAAHGAFVLGFWMPEKARAQTPIAKPSGAAWYEDPATPEVNAWIVVAPDETVVTDGHLRLFPGAQIKVVAPTSLESGKS